MGNVIGKSFDKYVIDQVKKRQNKLGTGNRSIDTIQLTNNKSSFLRLASSVNVDEEVARRLGHSTLVGDKLAKKMMLWGGVTSLATNDKGEISMGNLNSGIGTGGLNGAYGFGSKDFGYRPMPALEGASTTFYNNGSLQKATIKIKAFNVQQLELIETLYMKLGYTILLEWGHTKFVNNKGVVTSFDDLITDPLNYLFKVGSEKKARERRDIESQKVFAKSEKGILNKQQRKAELERINKINFGINPNDLYEAIKKTREEYDGNYDAFYGKVTKFNWSFSEDGSYAITIDAISLGDIIESLKSNNNMGFKIKEEEEEEVTTDTTDKKNKKEEKEEPAIVSNRDRSNIDRWLYKHHKKLDRVNKNRSVSGKGGYFTSYNNMFIKDDDGNILYKIARPFLRLNYGAVEGKEQNPQDYVKFGLLLRFLEKNINIFTSTETTTESTNVETLIKYDWDFDENYCLTYPGQISSDPKVCVIPMVNPGIDFDLSGLSDKEKIEIQKMYFGSKEQVRENLALPEVEWRLLPQATGKQFNGNGKISMFIGRLMHIHVNFSFISECLEKSQDSNGFVKLFDFLQKILNGISTSLGSINEFSVSFNADSNSLVIRENKSLMYEGAPGAPKKSDPIAVFQSYGVGKLGGSFLKGIDFNVTIPKEMATMISVGAQSNGNQPGENATSFSKINLGHTDRIAPIKQTIPNDDQTLTPLEKFVDNLRKTIPLLSNLYTWGDNKKAKINEEDVKTLRSLNKDYAQYMIGSFTNLGIIPSPTFIPFDLSLKMEGLSGMKIWEKFTIEEDILPSMYRPINGSRIIEFLIKGVEHEISNNTWTTTLNTLAAPSEFNTNSKKIYKSNGFDLVGEGIRSGIGGISIDSRGSGESNFSYIENIITPEEENELLELMVILRRFQKQSDSNLGEKIISNPSEAQKLPKGQTLSSMSIKHKPGGNVVEKFAIKAVELPYRDNKNNISAIPQGTYNVGKRFTEERGWHFHIQSTFPGAKPFGRSWILIHSSNYASQLLGCIAPGKIWMDVNGRSIGVTDSKAMMKRLVDALPDKFRLRISNWPATLPEKVSNIPTHAKKTRHPNYYGN